MTSDARKDDHHIRLAGVSLGMGVSSCVMKDKATHHVARPLATKVR